MGRKSHGLILQDESGHFFLTRGDHVKFDLEDGRLVDIPNNWMMYQDVLGGVLPVCTVMIAPYALRNGFVHIEDPAFGSIVNAYFGHDVRIKLGKVKLPQGDWSELGRVARIYYARSGEYCGKYHHDFKLEAPPVRLMTTQKSTSYMVVLPRGCVVDSHGFVWP